MDIKEPNDYIKAYILIFCLVPQVSHILLKLQGVQAHNYTCVCYSHFQLEQFIQFSFFSRLFVPTFLVLFLFCLQILFFSCFSFFFSFHILFKLLFSFNFSFQTFLALQDYCTYLHAQVHTLHLQVQHFTLIS